MHVNRNGVVWFLAAKSGPLPEYRSDVSLCQLFWSVVFGICVIAAAGAVVLSTVVMPFVWWILGEMPEEGWLIWPGAFAIIGWIVLGFAAAATAVVGLKEGAVYVFERIQHRLNQSAEGEESKALTLASLGASRLRALKDKVCPIIEVRRDRDV